MSFRTDHYAALAKTLIAKMEKRHFEAHYCTTKKEALALALSLIPDGASVTHGGCMTIEEIGLVDAVKQGVYNYIDRSIATTPEEKREAIAKGMMAHTFLMSANAISRDGELVNIDGFGNRIALLAYGPDQVIVLAGMNKVAGSLESAVNRARNEAAPINCVRLNRQTPCLSTGVCGDCHSADCICSNIVITRNNPIPGRIKVILIGEACGY